MINKTKLTAVEWYINISETLYKQFVTNWITLEVYIECKDKLVQEAKEMEKEQTRLYIKEKWVKYRQFTNKDDAWLFKEFLLELT